MIYFEIVVAALYYCQLSKEMQSLLPFRVDSTKRLPLVVGGYSFPLEFDYSSIEHVGTINTKEYTLACQALIYPMYFKRLNA